MQNKLQELTDKLYNEGLSKGRKEAEELLAKAKEEAKSIIEAAKLEAEAIVSQAEKDAAAAISTAESDIRMASEQTVSALRQQVENTIVTKAVAGNVGKAMSDTAFVKDLIKTIATAFKASDPDSKGLDLILSESQQKELGEAFAAEVAEELGTGVEVKNVKGLSDGFRIGPKDGGYIISFTADDFTNIISEYLRPATKKILFGK